MKKSILWIFVVFLLPMIGFSQWIPFSEFGENGLVSVNQSDQRTHITQVHPLNNGKKLVVGFMKSAIETNPFNRLMVSRLNEDGSFDPDFGFQGQVVFDFGSNWPEENNRIVVQSDGKILVGFHYQNQAESNRKIAVLRLSDDGSLDVTFGVNGIRVLELTDDYIGELGQLKVLENDSILIVGKSFVQSEDFLICRLTSSGNLDADFGENGIRTINIADLYSGNAFTQDAIRDVVISQNNELFLAGYSSNPSSGLAQGCVLKLHANGSIDSSFGSNGVMLFSELQRHVDFSKILLDSDNNLLLVGNEYAPVGYSINTILVRINDNGNIDSAFGDQGKAIINYDNWGFEPYISSAFIDSNQNIHLVGTDYILNKGFIVRLNSFGAPYGFEDEHGWYEMPLDYPLEIVGSNLDYDSNILVYGNITNGENPNGMIYKIGLTQLSSAENQLSKVIVYPNPFTDHITLKTTESISEITLFDSYGRKIIALEIQQNQELINIRMPEAVSPGCYILQVKSENKTFNQKLIKN